MEAGVVALECSIYAIYSEHANQAWLVWARKCHAEFSPTYFDMPGWRVCAFYIDPCFNCGIKCPYWGDVDCRGWFRQLIKACAIIFQDEAMSKTVLEAHMAAGVHQKVLGRLSAKILLPGSGLFSRDVPPPGKKYRLYRVLICTSYQIYTIATLRADNFNLCTFYNQYNTNNNRYIITLGHI